MKIPRSLAKYQSGVVLVISLIMLLALTLIGITGSSVSGLEEKMAANNKDVNLAFQAAEATLRDVEANLSTATLYDTPGMKMYAMRTAPAADAAQGTAGLYSFLGTYVAPATSVPAKNPVPGYGTTAPVPYTSTTCPSPKTFTPDYCVDWDATTNTRYAPYPARTGNPDLTGVAKQPVYIIEELSSINAGAGSTSGGSLGGGSDYSPIQSAQAEIWFRITAHGWGSNTTSVATVQTIVKVTYNFCC